MARVSAVVCGLLLMAAACTALTPADLGKEEDGEGGTRKKWWKIVDGPQPLQLMTSKDRHAATHEEVMMPNGVKSEKDIKLTKAQIADYEFPPVVIKKQAGPPKARTEADNMDIGTSSTKSAIKAFLHARSLETKPGFSDKEVDQASKPTTLTVLQLYLKTLPFGSLEVKDADDGAPKKKAGTDMRPEKATTPIETPDEVKEREKKEKKEDGAKKVDGTKKEEKVVSDPGEDKSLKCSCKLKPGGSPKCEFGAGCKRDGVCHHDGVPAVVEKEKETGDQVVMTYGTCVKKIVDATQTVEAKGKGVKEVEGA